MSKEKGFTLVELLAVVVVLGVIALIAVPAISRVINKSEKDTLKIQENLFLEAGVNYFLDKIADNSLQMELYETHDVTLSTLIDLGYIKAIKDPNTGNLCDADSTVKIAYAGGRQYEYADYFSCGDYITIAGLPQFKMVNYDFLSGAYKYMSDHTESLPANAGNRVSVSYSTLKTNGYITALNDILTDTECSSTSKVVVEKTASNSYNYLSGLICANYAKIEAWDLLQGAGNFSKDTNDDDLADNWSSSSSGNFSVDTLDGIQGLKASAQGGGIKSPLTITVDHIFYVSGIIKSASGATLYADVSGQADISASYSDFNTFSRISGRSSLTNGASIYVGIKDDDTTDLDPIYARKIFFIDLTSMYSTNEPSLTEMDAILKNSGY